MTLTLAQEDEAQSTVALSVGIDRYLDWNRAQFESDHLYSHPTRTDDIDEVVHERYHQFQRAVSWVMSEEFLQLIDQSVIGHVVAVDPFRPVYSTAALIGEWSEERRTIWRQWMGATRTRHLSEGNLFRQLYGRSYGEALFIHESWRESPSISGETRSLDLGYPVVVPLVCNRQFIGILTLATSALLHRERFGPLLFKLGQLIVVPLLQPESLAIGQSSLIFATTTVFRPIAERVEKALSEYRGMLGSSIAQVDGIVTRLEKEIRIKARSELVQALRSAVTGIKAVSSGMFHESQRGTAYLDLLMPKSDPEDEVAEFGRVVKKALALILADPEADYEHLFDANWVHVEETPGATLPIGRKYLSAMMIELLANAVKAVCDLIVRLSTVETDANMDSIAHAGVSKYTAARGGAPAIDISLSTSGNEVVLAVRDNGIGMPPEIRARATDFGFSTKHTGTGTGLTIVSSIAALSGGRVSVESRTSADVADDKLTYSEVRVSFPSKGDE